MELTTIKSSSLLDLRRQSELPSPSQLKDIIEGRRPSLLEKERKTCQCLSWSAKAVAYKNLFGVSISYWIIFSAFLVVVGLQSSLNEELGLVSLSVLYVTFLLSGFYTSAFLRLLGTKLNLLISYTAMLIYTLSNYYPHWYTLVPGSICLGLAFGPLWASLNVHVTTSARRFAQASHEKPAYIIFLFTGIHTLCYKLAYIPANIASTVILFARRSDSPLNVSDDICNNTEAANVGEVPLYTMLSLYVIFDIIAIVIVLVFVDHLGTSTRLHSFGKMMSLYFKQPVIATIKMLFEWKMLLIFPMIILDGFVISFGLGRFAKVSLHNIMIHCMSIYFCSTMYLIVLVSIGLDYHRWCLVFSVV